MNLKKTVTLLAISALAIGVLAGCGGNKNDAADKSSSSAAQSTKAEDKTIVIGASPAPHKEILEALKPEFEKEGYQLEIKEFTDYVQPNKALADGELDANYFQHGPFLENFNKENKTDLVSVVYAHYEPMAIFPGKSKTLDALPEGGKIAVPNDVSNEARALLLLADNGLITLKDGVDINATVKDIEDNPKKLDIVEMEAAQIPRALQDVDLAVINGNFAIASDIPFDTHLAAEDENAVASKVYANLVAMRAEDKDSEKAKVLHKVLTGEACKKYITEHYKGTVVPLDDAVVVAYLKEHTDKK